MCGSHTKTHIFSTIEQQIVTEDLHSFKRRKAHGQMVHNIKLQPSGVKEEAGQELRSEGVTEALFLSTVTGTVLFKHQDICTAYFETAQKGFFLIITIFSGSCHVWECL